MATDCPCKGERRWKWHKNRGLKQCLASRMAKRPKAYPYPTHEIADEWVPGTSIYIPENEAP